MWSFNIRRCAKVCFGCSNRSNSTATSAFPKDADCLLFCHFFTIWGEEMDRDLLKKAYDSLPSGGKVIIFNMMQNNSETGPLKCRRRLTLLPFARDR